VSDAPVAIVTGAGSGIGRCASTHLAKAGYRVALVGRREEALIETQGLIDGPETLVLPVDVSDAAQAASVVVRTVETWGRLDALVNNAGAAPLEPIEKTSEYLLLSTFAVNAFGPAHLIAQAWPVFKRQESGCVVNVSTAGTADPFPGFFAYAASKAALESMTRSVMREGAAYGIRAFSVAPGAVETELLRGLFDEDAVPSSAALAPDDVAAAICDCVLGRRDADAGTVIRLSR
jgi:NAD(P)-dependent dehydrogenase (short-subunit alcohol dehydrogenase family)